MRAGGSSGPEGRSDHGAFGSLGARLEQLAALIAYLTVVCRMPRRVVEELLAQVLGIQISLGSTQKCWEEASQAVAAPCQELEQRLKDEPVLNADETGWRTNGDKRFLWAFSSCDGGAGEWGHYVREKGTSDVVTLWPACGAQAPDLKWRLF